MRGCTCHGLTLCSWCEALLARAVGSGVPGAGARPDAGTPGIARPHLTEKAFQAAVVRVARAHGWLYWHAYTARKSVPGYPDLTLAKAGQPVIFSELKIPGGHLTLQQEAWLEALSFARGKVVYAWTPAHWPLIVEVLTR